jgi:serine/threonine-protein kinase
VLVELPKGSYAAVFRYREPQPPDPAFHGSANILKVRPTIPALLPVAIALLGIGVILWKVWPNPRSSDSITRIAIGLPPNHSIAVDFQPAVAFSSDGRHLVYADAPNDSAPVRLYLRAMDQFDAAPIVGTERASGPFFSPDATWIGFFADGKLKKVSLSGGSPEIVAEAPSGRGASWGPDGTIVFTPASAPGVGLLRVPATGGARTVLTTPDSGKGETGHRWPEILPGGDAVLFTIWTGGGFDTARIAVLSLKSGKQRVLVEGGSNAHYAATGHLIFHRAGGLLAVPFDLARLEVTREPFPILQGVMTDARSGAAQFGLADSGSLVYVPGSAVSAESTLVWVDRNGATQPG